jgi:hypothetical protein
LIFVFAFASKNLCDVLGALKDVHYVDDFSLDLVVDQVVFESFDGELANLGEFGVGEAAESAHSWEFGDLLEGGFGGIEESIDRRSVID